MARHRGALYAATRRQVDSIVVSRAGLYDALALRQHRRAYRRRVDVLPVPEQERRARSAREALEHVHHRRRLPTDPGSRVRPRCAPNRIIAGVTYEHAVQAEPRPNSDRILGVQSLPRRRVRAGPAAVPPEGRRLGGEVRLEDNNCLIRCVFS